MMGRPCRLHWDEIFELRKLGNTHAAIAKKVGARREYIWRLWKKHNIKPLKKPGFYKKDVALKAIDHIVTNGGFAWQAIKILDLDVTGQTVRCVTKQQGINLKDYYHINKQNDNWIIETPGYHRHETGYVIISATCKHCGHKQRARLFSIQYSKHAPLCEVCGGGTGMGRSKA